MENACCCRWYINVIMYCVYAMKILQGLVFNPKHLIFNEIFTRFTSNSFIIIIIFIAIIYIICQF